MDETVNKGDYVLATKYADGDPGDPWGIGFYDREEHGRHFILDGKGENIRAGGFRRAGKITEEFGAWLLLEAARVLEKSPPGTVNLWGMMGAFAKPSGEAGVTSSPLPAQAPRGTR